MTSQPKPRRKKAIEALDWRELAEAPALRGLSEVLSTPPEVARERAAKRADLEADRAGDTPTVGETSATAPSEVGAPTVGESMLEDAKNTADPEAAPTVGLTTSTGVSPTEEHSPTVGHTLAVDSLPRLVPVPARSSGRPRQSPYTVASGVGHPPTVGVTPSALRAGWWVDSLGTRYEGKRVQRVVIAQHSMSLGEERVYETLWHAREGDGVYTESRRSKTFSLGYDRIARLVRLNEKSVRLLLPKLIQKKILEVVAAEHSASRTGRTYRIFSYEEILERQRAANLTAVVKNGRAVEFVWPVQEGDGSVGVAPTVGISSPVESPTVGGSSSAYPSELALKVRAILPSFDEEALQNLWNRCVGVAADCTADEVEYSLQLKARQLLSRSKAVNNPVGLMLWAVPKCFEGADALHLVYRRQKDAEAELRRQEDERFRVQLEEYRRLAADPSTSPEDRAWYRRMLADLG